MSNQCPNDKKRNNFDLEERTAKFGENIIEFAKKIPKNSITLPLISQLIRAGTSIGANYCEADGADSKKDFVHKIGISKREARETKHWLRMIVKAVPALKDEAKILWREAQELNLIFSSIIKTCRKVKENPNDKPQISNQ
jgi:four helix bundle protein